MIKIRFCIHCGVQLSGKNSKTCGSIDCIKKNKRIHDKKRIINGTKSKYLKEYIRQRKLLSEEYRIKCSEKNKKYYREHKEKKREQYRVWNIKNKDKIRDRLYRKKYGKTLKEINDIIASQNYKCAICDIVLIEPQVDHNHITNQIRGVLCRKCNVTLGNVQENINILKNMIDYLEDWKYKNGIIDYGTTY